MNKEKIAVVFSIDDAYAMLLASALKSMSINFLKNQEDKVLCIYIMDLGINWENRDKLEACIPDTPLIELFFLLTPSFPDLIQKYDKSGVYLKTKKWRAENEKGFGRFYIPELLHEKHDKAIFLDADVLILDDITKLWDTPNPENKSISAAVDQICYWDFDLKMVELNMSYMFNFFNGNAPLKSLVKSKRYFNAGVIVYHDLKKLYKEELIMKLVKMFTSYSFTFLDQDALNLVFKNDVNYLNNEWNANTICSFLTSYHAKNGYNEIFEKQSAKLAHFTFKPGPWDGLLRHPYTDEWFKYLDKTPWKGYKPEKKSDMDMTIRVYIWFASILLKTKNRKRLILFAILDTIFSFPFRLLKLKSTFS